ncbi:MAG: hypothetical protein K9N55_09085 [Phycisphaerae bacterium]|nr:hypothetical protein [Phycisphaerae bacterium]
MPPIRSQESSNTEQPEPVTPDVTPDLTITPETSDETQLQFNPSPGLQQAMRVTTQLVMSNLYGGQLLEMTSTQSVTVDLDVQDPQADGAATLNVSISQIKVKMESQGMADEYDSAEPSSQDSPVAEFYSPFVGQTFTIHVSRQGEIVHTGLDELYLAAAQNRIKAEDDMIRTQNGEKADAVIQRTDRRFGSQDSRILAMKKQLEEFPLFGQEQVLRLLGDLIAPLPSQPIENNMTWDGMITVKAEINEDVPATYSVTSLDEETCVIEAQGERSEEEPPFVYQADQTTITSDLAGSSQVTLIVDRRTGWLKGKTQKTLLNGPIQQSLPGQADTETATQVIMDITTTVEPVE